MEYRYNGNTSLKYSILVHRDIEVRFGLTAKKAAEIGAAPEDIGHTLESRTSIAATRVVRDLDELRAAVENAEALAGRDPAARLAPLDAIAAELWPAGEL